MRNLGVQELPPPHKTGWCAVLESVIAKALTDMRCYVKAQVSDMHPTCIDEYKTNQERSQISSSIADEKENCNNIAMLTDASIGTTKAQSTLALRMQLAFLVREEVSV